MNIYLSDFFCPDMCNVITLGGILSGKHKFTKDTNQIAQGRFNKQGWAKIYRERFWNQSTFDAVKMIQDAITEVYGDKLTILEASIVSSNISRYISHVIYIKFILNYYRCGV